MAKPSFIFTSLRNSFSVHIPNLESLSVEQIQEIESFVHTRKGVFDFSTYKFSVQKRMEYVEFIKLIDSLSLDVNCSNNPLVIKAKPRVGFGQYKGMQYSELPDSYLLWLHGNYSGSDKSIILQEIKTRRL